MSKAQNSVQSKCTSVNGIGKYLLVQKKEWVTSDGNIGTLGTSFGLNWIFLDTIQCNDFTWNFVGNSSNSWENEFYFGFFFKTTLILFSLIFVANVSILYFYTLCLPT
ncbi:hypothetical protein NQ315_005979, partial [Exocentrus adspersus]